VEEGLANLARLDHTVVFVFSGVRILPKSPLHERAVREGDRPGDPLLQPVFYHSPAIEKDAMNDRIKAALPGKRDRIFPASAGQERLKVMHRFGHRDSSGTGSSASPRRKRPLPGKGEPW